MITYSLCRRPSNSACETLVSLCETHSQKEYIINNLLPKTSYYRPVSIKPYRSFRVPSIVNEQVQISDARYVWKTRVISLILLDPPVNCMWRHTTLFRAERAAKSQIGFHRSTKQTWEESSQLRTPTGMPRLVLLPCMDHTGPIYPYTAPTLSPTRRRLSSSFHLNRIPVSCSTYPLVQSVTYSQPSTSDTAP